MRLFDHLQREATKLEFELDVSWGRIEMRKRSDPTWFFRSEQSADDPRAILAALKWLQYYRCHVLMVEAYHRQRQLGPRLRWGKYVTTCLLLVLIGILAVVLHHQLLTVVVCLTLLFLASFVVGCSKKRGPTRGR